MKRLYFRPSGVSRRALALIAALSACLMLAVEKLPVQQKQAYYEQKVAAATLAAEAMRAIREERLARNLRIDPETDPAGTGLIGIAYSPVTSDTGDLIAKRTAANPNFAAVLVQMLREAGVRRGDRVAVGLSGSFPGMNVAAYAALQTLEEKPLIIASASASEFGANQPELLWLDMEKLLFDRNLIHFRAPAASRGGIDDRGFRMPEQSQALLDAAIARYGLRKVDAESLADAIDLRMQVYGELAQGKPIRAYLNIGGGSASVGRRKGKKQLQPGVNLPPPRGATPVDSVMQRFLQRGVPVVHITNIASLAKRYGLPVDPKVTPKPGEGSVYVKATYNRWLALAGVIIILLAIVALTRLDLDLRLLGASGRVADRPEPQQMI
jgi:poly-gamma-glutamate system protein